METAKLFCEVTGNERVCFLNTGSEAVQAAMRIARTVTGRDKVLVFDKDYHGNFDPVLVRSVGSGAKRRTLPLAPGIPASAVQDVIVVPWGKPEALDMIREVAGELAAVLVEPVQSRQPEWIPVDFVHEVKRISEEYGFLLVFDEVITGLRQGPHGAQDKIRSSRTSPPTARFSAAARCRSASSPASRNTWIPSTAARGSMATTRSPRRK